MTLMTMKKYKAARAAYELGNDTGLTDDEYDALEFRLRSEFPDDPIWDETGSPVADKKYEVDLPVPMASLNKKYPKDIDKLKPSLVPHLTMHKLDGCSILAHYNARGRLAELYTRGDGIKGKCISHLIKHVAAGEAAAMPLPFYIGVTDDTYIRMEAIIDSDTFDHINSIMRKRKQKPYQNARAAVSGLLNATAENADPELLQLISFFVIAVHGMPTLNALRFALKNDFMVVRAITGKYPVTQLAQVLAHERKGSTYAIDGLVVIPEPDDGYFSETKPTHMWAFKNNVDFYETTVTDIDWNVSRTGRYAPRISITPVKIDGTRVSRATAHNYAWMKEQGVGIGAKILVCKSGDVIPAIQEVLEPSDDMNLPPSYAIDGRHIIAASASAPKRIAFFLSTIGVEGFKETSAEKVIDQLPNIQAYLRMWRNGNYSVIRDNVGAATAKSLQSQLEDKLDGLPLSTFMRATGLFAADKAIDQIVDEYDGDQTILLNLNKKTLINLPKWQEKRVANFLKNYDRFLTAVDIARKLGVTFNMRAASKSLGTVAFTGYRNKDHEAALTELGYRIVAYTKSVNILLIKEGYSNEKTKQHPNVKTFNQLMKDHK